MMGERTQRSAARTRFGILASFALVALVAPVTSCTRASVERRIVRIDPVANHDLVVIAFSDGSIEGRSASRGARRWRSLAGKADDLGFGAQPPEVAMCPIRPLSGGRLLVVRPSRIDVLDGTSGRRVARAPRRRAGRPSICPAAAPDGTFIDAVPSFHGSGLLIKYDAGGREVWRHANPDIGPLTGAVSVDSVTGDVIVTSNTHVMAVSPSGQTNWVVAHRRSR